ncbi:putative Mitochondrial pyruvate carrier [Seiridium unicorne]|uniref:Mitochondrial pyruvate carrier n=1 Tax=Seiridium unicorne TaxID=138068 RepID=A0ABR2UWE9_9PEZI
MPATTSLFRAARPAFRQSAFGAHRAAFQSQRASAGRRWQSTTAGESQSWFSRMWNSPIGFKTVHFWAPVMKWALVLAGISDFARPAEKLSLTQNGALTATGLIWTRWCFVITPKNYLLAAVNFFLGIVGVVQCSRIFMYHQSVKNAPLPAAAELKEDAKDKAVELKEDAKEKVESVKAAIKSQ